MKKKFLHFFIASLLLSIGALNVSAQFSGGSGSASNPYIVTTQAQLYSMGGVASAQPDTLYFKLGGNIALSGAWTPIGRSPQSPFQGHFDGNNFVISGLSITNAGQNDAGLFGKTNGAEISNLAVIATQLKETAAVGILIGTATGGTVENVRTSITSGAVEATTGYCGGLIGQTSGTAIINCRSTAAVGVAGNNPTRLGGLVGYANGGSITESYANGNVHVGTGNDAGGLVGMSSASITNCYATGSVTSTKAAGTTSTLSSYTNSSCGSFNTYSFSPATVNLGGLVGSSTGTITNCYAQGNIAVQSLNYTSAATYAGTTTCSMVTVSYYTPTNVNGYPSNFAGLVEWWIYQLLCGK